MCMSSSPSAPPPPPPPQYLHNPFLDGATMSGGSNTGRNSLVTSQNGTFGGSGVTTVTPRIGPMTRPGSPGPSAPSNGVTLPAGTIPMMGQPGTVVPTVGGVMAGLMGGRVTTPTVPPSALMRGAAK